MNFELTSAYKPTGDQPEAIAQLTDGVIQGLPAQTLLGVTGSGKTFTIANVIANINKPTLILSHNKTLAAQLYSEFKAFFPNNASLVLLSIYAIGIFLAVLLARLFSKFLVKGDDTPFVMELPPYRMPTAKSIFRHTWEKGAQYLKKMGGIIMIASIIIWFLGYYPNHDAYETVAEQQENSYIGQLGRGIEPVIKPLGFDWKLGIGLLSGVGAKELVVSTLGVLYADDPDADSVSLAERIPITPLVAFCYMLFVLIYFPCTAATPPPLPKKPFSNPQIIPSKKCFIIYHPLYFVHISPQFPRK